MVCEHRSKYFKLCIFFSRNMGLSQTIYNICFKRTSSMVVTIGVGAFVYERRKFAILLHILDFIFDEK